MQTTPFTVGGNNTLTAFMNALSSIPSMNPNYWYGPILAEHIEKIASVPIRNVSGIHSQVSRLAHAFVALAW